MSEIASHSDVDQEEQKGLSDEQLAEVMQSLGYAPKTQEKADQTTENEQDEDDESEDAPAIEQSKKLKVQIKRNKKQEEVEIDESELPDYIERALALEKERERKTEAEKALQRAAKLAGYDKVEDYLANLDNIEKQSVQKQKDQFAELKAKLREEAEENGLDPELFEQFMDNHPLLQQANEVLTKQEQEREAAKVKEAEQASVKAWETLFTKYPELHEQMNEDGASAPWMTDDFIARINRGYDPVDAYELLNKDAIREREREITRQQVLKENRLNKRAKVEGNSPTQIEDDVPDNVKAAFAAFGLDPKTAKKFMK